MKKSTMMTIILSALFAVTCTGCSYTNNATAELTESAAVAESAAEESAEETAPESEAEDAPAISEASAVIQTAAAANISGVLNTEGLFTDRDLLQTADLSSAQNITVSDGDSIALTEAGVYVLSGSAENCTITVEADSKDKIQIVLDGVSITNTDSPAIYVKSADKVFITTTNTENTLTVSGSFTADGETDTDAVIFSKDDLTLNGTGTLKIVSASGSGVSSKDSLKITGGTYVMQAGQHAFEANDMLAVSGGSFTIDTEKDGFHCAKDTEGNIYIADGTFTISAGSDALQATAYMQIDGGTFTIDSAEGLESSYIQINGGEISINASDDGINAPEGGNVSEIAVEINGGNLTIVMAQGDTDGIDANGSVYVNGGKIDITAPCASFDYDRNAEFNGGTIIINGEEVSEIPQEMMGGFGGHGGFGGQGGFGRPDNFGGENGEMPELPEGFEGQGGFGGFGRPDDFGGQDGEMPEMPEDFDGQGGFGRHGGRGKRGGSGTDSSSQQDTMYGGFDEAIFNSESVQNDAI